MHELSESYCLRDAGQGCTQGSGQGRSRVKRETLQNEILNQIAGGSTVY